jgi:type IV pilus assembly protein PilM
MARRLIGLDVGTNAVTVAEVSAGEPPRLELFAQVALPRDAMREGEVADEGAVAEAVARLRAEVGLKKTPVRVGVASPRVIVRQVDMPLMSRDELASALQFQAGDLIPIPIEDAVLDFAILGSSNNGEGGEQTMRVLLAAAQANTVTRLVSAVEAGGLPVAAVDLQALALTRALSRHARAYAPAPAGAGGIAVADSGGAEGIVSFGGGVTAITVHEGGVPRFVRVLGTGGRELTDAIAAELNIPAETAEALKRQLATGAGDELVARARTAIERPLAVLLDEVRSSIDYYRNQPGANRLSRVIATGGSSQLPGLPERMSALVGVPVDLAQPREMLAIGDIGFPPEELPRLDAYLPAAVGLALGGAGVGTVVDLMPRNRKSATKKSVRNGVQFDPKLVAGAVALIVVLGGATLMSHQKLSSEKSKKQTVVEHNTELEQQIAKYADVQKAQLEVAAIKAQMTQLLQNDVGWPKVLDDLAHTLPAGVTFTSFQATVTQPVIAAPTPPPAEGTAAPSGESSSSPDAAAAAPATPTVTAPLGLNGTITMAGTAPSYEAVAAWLDTVAKDKAVANVWTGTIQRSQVEGQTVVTWQATAILADAARSGRLDTLVKGKR